MRAKKLIAVILTMAAPCHGAGPYTSKQGNVDTEYSVNRLHPLFKNLTNWYLTLPDRRGGTNVRDLMHVIDGTLTSSGSSTKGWSPVTRPAGYGSLLYDSTSASYIAVASKSQFSYIQNTMIFTISAWMSINALTTRQLWMATADSSSQKGFFLAFENGAGVGTKAMRMVLFRAIGGTSVWAGRTGDNVITDSLWHHVVFVGNGTSVAMYVDGVSQSITVEGAFTTVSSGDANCNLAIGYDACGALLPFGGNMDDVAFFSNQFSAADVMNLYNLSKQGYPGILNKIKPTFHNLVPASAAAATITPQRTLTGVGL